MPGIGTVRLLTELQNRQPKHHMKKLKSAQRDANPAPGRLVHIEGLSELKGLSVREIRTLIAKGILSYFSFGYRSKMFDPDTFDRDIAAFEVKSVGGRNGRGGK